MEEQVYKKLSTEQKELLGTIFETQTMKAILTASDIYQQDKALHIAVTAPNFENVILNRGNIAGARFIYDLCQFANKKMKKVE
jgi:hypothetical protein